MLNLFSNSDKIQTKITTKYLHDCIVSEIYPEPHGTPPSWKFYNLLQRHIHIQSSALVYAKSRQPNSAFASLDQRCVHRSHGKGYVFRKGTAP